MGFIGSQDSGASSKAEVSMAESRDRTGILVMELQRCCRVGWLLSHLGLP